MGGTVTCRDGEYEKRGRFGLNLMMHLEVGFR